MKRIIKAFGSYLIGVFNFNIPRNFNGKWVYIPVRSGIKLGISGEKWMSGILKGLFKHENGTFLDIGVNLGQTLTKVKTIDPDRSYIGFEPNPSCIFYIRNLIDTNNWHNITLVPAGLYCSDRILKLYGLNDTHGASTITNKYLSEAHGVPVAQYISLFTGNTIKKTIPLNDISIIKIDVEGAELEVLESLSELIWDQRPVILLEAWHNNSISQQSKLEVLRRLVKKIGYRVYGWQEIRKAPYYTDLNLTELGKSSNDNHLLLPNEKHLKIISGL